MQASQIARGVVLKCLFPYDNDPHQPGPKPHYCLVADIPFSVGDQHYVAVAYGTSKLDENLLRAHRGLILSVDSAHLKGSALPGPVSHFVLDHVALVPLHEDWIYSDFRARFDFMREEQRRNDRERQRLYETFLLAERQMLAATDELLETFDRTQLIGLPQGKTLR
ncbi:hypothetical protein [Burkholderia stabilis]|uniref:hypothetical protein n=1 Tax=Burkholderia stabilis TaxID=95485 RepID=UPI0013CE579E|nr:hypothetical protein [Burkholderia stabilis]